MQRKYERNNPDYLDFYEEISSSDGQFTPQETLDTRSREYSGMTEDNVHKLAEDMFNPIPLSDKDSLF